MKETGTAHVTAADEARDQLSGARYDMRGNEVPAGQRMIFEALGAVAVALGRLADAVAEQSRR